jgi:chromosomal replication initiator protein
MTPDPLELWAECLLCLERHVTPQTFNTWFRPIAALHFDPDQLLLQVPSSYFGDWVQSRYLSLITDAVTTVTGTTPPIHFTVAGANSPAPSAPAPTPPPAPPAPEPPTRSAPTPPPVPSPQTPFTPLNARYTFSTFVIGESNRFAHAAAQAVAQSPGRTQYNPLVIHGGVGLGKTHLLQAIGHHALASASGHRVAFVPSERFMSDFIEAIKTQKTAQFRQLYRSPDILLVDDIQFLLRGEQTQNEFFHTFNALHQNGKQIVMTCDSPPGQLQGMEERLISRFQWGLVTSIDPPDLETRIAILHQKAEITGLSLPADVATFLGTHISSNIRELEGSLVHLMAYCSVNRTELTIEAARQIVHQRGPNQPGKLTVDIIQQLVATHFGFTPALLAAPTRRREVVHARQVAMYLTKQFLSLPLKSIGLSFGGRDHTTVLHAINAVETRRRADADFAQTLSLLCDTIEASRATP